MIEKAVFIFAVLGGTYACYLQFDAAQRISSTGPDGVDCEDGWTAYHQHCYKAFTAVSADFSAAVQHCKAAAPEAVLPSIHNTIDNGVFLVMTSHTAFWTGLTNMTGGGGGQWSWADGSAVDYVNWAAGKPALDGGRSSCVWVYEGDATWTNSQCNLHLGAVLCQI